MNPSPCEVPWAARLASLALLLCGCARHAAGDRLPPPTPVLHTDVATVEQFVSLPGVVAVRWVEEPVVRPDSRTLVPGPADFVLTAYVELDPAVWPALEKALGGAKGSATVRMKESWAELILTPRALEQLPREGDARVVTVTDYDIRALRTGTRQGSTGQRVGSGLLMSFSTM